MDMRSRARELRRASTDAERAFWRQVRDRGLGGHKFRRQVPIGPYIADFLCLQARLIIEFDGGHHQGTDRSRRAANAVARKRGLSRTAIVGQRCASQHHRSAGDGAGSVGEPSPSPSPRGRGDLTTSHPPAIAARTPKPFSPHPHSGQGEGYRRPSPSSSAFSPRGRRDLSPTLPLYCCAYA